MTKVINMNVRGTLTLPKGMRQRLGLESGCQVVAEETTKGVLIRPCVMLPAENSGSQRHAKPEDAGVQTFRRYPLKNRR